MNLNQMSVKSKLTGAFGALSVIVLIVSGFSLKELIDANDRFSSDIKDIKARADMAQAVRSAVDDRAIALRNLVLVTKPDDIELEKTTVIDAARRVEANLDKFNAMVAGAAGISDKSRSLAAEISRIEMLYRPVALDITRLAMNNQRDVAIAEIDAKCRPLLSALIRAVNAYVDVTREHAAQAVRESADQSSGQRNLLIAICLAAIAVAVLAGVVIKRESETQEGLVCQSGQARACADATAHASKHISSDNVDLSSRTERQAAPLQDTASRSEAAGNDNDVVIKVVDTMGEISASYAKIADITEIIEGIAFHTNILALNAAAEAARAGEQVRGFAVIASEVRCLAQRSSSAAKAIKELINASALKILDGSALANEAGKTMSEVRLAVARVTDIMGEIAAASIEQSRGIEQVNQAITQMDEVTQLNAALVEEAAAASKSLVTLTRFFGADLTQRNPA